MESSFLKDKIPFENALEVFNENFFAKFEGVHILQADLFDKEACADDPFWKNFLCGKTLQNARYFIFGHLTNEQARLINNPYFEAKTPGEYEWSFGMNTLISIIHSEGFAANPTLYREVGSADFGQYGKVFTTEPVQNPDFLTFSFFEDDGFRTAIALPEESYCSEDYNRFHNISNYGNILAYRCKGVLNV